MKFEKPDQSSPIAVFDSGLGGLTVVRALRERMPAEEFIYFGDTARVPYGCKSTETVTRFSREICQFLMHFSPKSIVAACNTASAVALQSLSDDLPVPVVGVVDAGSRMTVRTTRSEIVAVLGTEATIASGAYERAIRHANPKLRVVQQSCPLFVPVVEEGRLVDDPIVIQAVADYLEPVRRLRPDVVLLGCTHYPLLREALQAYFGTDVVLIDSGSAVAEEVRKTLLSQDLLSREQAKGTVQCYVSDFPQRFTTLGSRFLGEPLGRVVRASAESWQSPIQRVMNAS